MAREWEIDKFRRDAAAARVVAGGLLKFSAAGLNDWEQDFLESIQERTFLDELSYRQSEVLLEIRDDVERLSTYRGFSISHLINGCWERRLDLDEDSEAWVEELHAGDTTLIRRRFVHRLMRCARDVGLIDD